MTTTVGAADVLPGTLPMGEVTLSGLTVADPADLIEFPSTGDDLIVMYNTTGGPIGAIMNAGVDRYGRADGATITLGAGNIVVFGPLYPNDGWPVGGGNLRMTPGDPGIQTSCLALGKAG